MIIQPFSHLTWSFELASLNQISADFGHSLTCSYLSPLNLVVALSCLFNLLLIQVKFLAGQFETNSVSSPFRCSLLLVIVYLPAAAHYC